MSVILGVNHQFLFPDSITDPKVHTNTLKLLSASPDIQALDVWVWRGVHASEEIRILRGSGKQIHYNIGDRHGEAPVLPASANPAEQERAYAWLMREIGYAVEAGATKIILASGPDLPEDHAPGLARFGALLERIASQLPDNAVLSLEPADPDMDKHFLLGFLSEAVSFIEDFRKRFPRVGLLLDFCHVPLMHETPESALRAAGHILNHVHLGNCILRDPRDPLYGDRHVPWGWPNSEFSEADAKNHIRLLKAFGYLQSPGATVSFEMRPYPGMTGEDSLQRFLSVYKESEESI